MICTRRGEDSPYYDDLVEYGVTEVTLANEVPSGLHRFVFDNTAAVGSGPSGTVEFEASVSG